MKNRFKLLILAALTILVGGMAYAAPIDLRGAATMTETCTNVSTSVTILAANVNRVAYSIVTTTGAATIYIKGGTGAGAPPATNSAPVLAGAPYNRDPIGGYIYTGAVSAIAKTGTVYVCVEEISK